MMDPVGSASGYRSGGVPGRRATSVAVTGPVWRRMRAACDKYCCDGPGLAACSGRRALQVLL